MAKATQRCTRCDSCLRRCAQYLDLWPDRNNLSCMAAFNHSATANYVEPRPGVAPHRGDLDPRGNGRTRIYQDGLLMAEVRVIWKSWH